VPDISKVRELIGYEPTLGLDEIIRTVIEHDRSAGKQLLSPYTGR